MKKCGYAPTAAAVIWMAFSLGITAQAKSAYKLQIENQFDMRKPAGTAVHLSGRQDCCW